MVGVENAVAIISHHLPVPLAPQFFTTSLTAYQLFLHLEMEVEGNVEAAVEL